MKVEEGNFLYRLRWGLLRMLHTLDYILLLPLLGWLPLSLGYALSAVRGRINALTERDWRSMMMRSRHIARQSASSFQTLIPAADGQQIRDLVRERFTTESREEFEGRLIISGRVTRLHCNIGPAPFVQQCQHRERGLVLLTPHFDSFILGVVFLGRAGIKINLMSSLGDDSSRFNPGVYRHFATKYRSMERYLNGGRVVPMEVGPRPFYQMLARGECVVIVGDVPLAGDNTTGITPLFLGQRRLLSGGAMRMAQKTDSDLGAFVCHFDSHGQSGREYTLTGSTIKNASDPEALDHAYAFLSEQIMARPGRWWGVDLLTAMPSTDPTTTDAEHS